MLSVLVGLLVVAVLYAAFYAGTRWERSDVAWRDDVRALDEALDSWDAWIEPFVPKRAASSVSENKDRQR